MNATSRKIMRAFALCGSLLFCSLAFPASHCEPDGFQTSGPIYRVCMPNPEDYNGRLIIWAHGFQDANETVGIPEDQLRGTNCTAAVSQLGGFSIT